MRDVVTGEQRTRTLDYPAYWWAEGNGSCDCNRVTLFFPDHDCEDTGCCIGCVRYLIVGMEPMPEGYTLADLNMDYDVGPLPGKQC